MTDLRGGGAVPRQFDVRVGSVPDEPIDVADVKPLDVADVWNRTRSRLGGT